jgi:succinyl-diaminopimelate desuccinylase
VVIGEQSGLRVVAESRGIAQARLLATGVPAHAAYPWLGRNALLGLIAGIEAVLRRYPVPAAESWSTTVNVARIDTANRAVNQVPGDATAWLDIRFPPEDADFAGRTRQQIAEHLRGLAGDGVRVEVDSVGPPHRANPDRAEVGSLRKAARDAGYAGELLRKHGAADGRFYSERGIDAVIFGPGGDGQHSADEYLDIGTVLPYHDALVAFLRAIS